MLTAWRIIGTDYKDKAFTGDGARIYGGRWNSKGVSVIYTADSLALASIEMLVNLPAPKLLQKYVRISARFSRYFVLELSGSDLPEDWKSRPVSPSTQAIGDQWIKDRTLAVLKVPGIVVPDEYNYLINPVHPEFAGIEIGKPYIYFSDLCLIKKGDNLNPLVHET